MKLFFSISLITCSIFFMSLAGDVPHQLHEGKGLDDIILKKSPESDVIKKFGTDFKIITHHNEDDRDSLRDSIVACTEQRYEKLGLSFFYWGNDTTQLYTI